MSSLALKVLLVVTTSSALVLAAGGMAGCSDDDPVGPGDAGSESAKPDANRPAPLETDARPKTCRAQCEEAHPDGLPKDEAVNACWEMHCKAPCIEQTGDGGGGGGDGGVDGEAAEAGTCVSPVVTVSIACDECTGTFCCAEWDGCFQEPECVALNACYQQCTE